ncbi:MAG: Rid family hydrolase [Pseudomonadota bacterium]|nr:Rid family hydrolase [Pseudomonadota bacterium]
MTKRDLFLPGSGEFCRGIGACDATVVGEKLFISGQGGVDWTDNMTLLPTFEAQTRKTWVNIKTALDAAGYESEHIVQILMMIVHADDSEGTFSEKTMKIFEIKNEILPDSIPTGTTIGVSDLALPDLQVEIQVVAMK